MVAGKETVRVAVLESSTGSNLRKYLLDLEAILKRLSKVAGVLENFKTNEEPQEYIKA